MNPKNTEHNKQPWYLGIVTDSILQTESDCFTSKRQLSAQEPSFSLLEKIVMTGRKRPRVMIRTPLSPTVLFNFQYLPATSITIDHE